MGQAIGQIDFVADRRHKDRRLDFAQQNCFNVEPPDSDEYLNARLLSLS
jgi:hypothetical protein